MPKELNLNIPSEVLVVTIGEKQYSVPLAMSLPYAKVKVLSKALKGLKGADDIDGQLEIFSEFFKEYIPEDVLDKLPMKALYNLATAWGEGEGEDTSNNSLGES